jgi:hypothetical protein
MNGRKTAFGKLMDAHATPRLLFVCGVLLFPAFLFQADLGIRVAQVAAFFALSALTGRRVRIVQIALVALGIVAFNLVIPTGRVILSVFGLHITDEALRGGVAKATAVIGMIALSQLSIRSDLRLPGRLGGLIGRTFLYFERIMGERRRLGRDRILEKIDELLLQVHGMGGPSSDPEASPAVREAPRTTLAGYLTLGTLVGVNWGLLLLTRLHPGLIWAR